MHLRVELFWERNYQECVVCHEAAWCRRAVVFLGTGSQETPFLCSCCELQQERVQVDVLQADMKPGRQAPDKKTRRLSNRQERRIAADVGGRTQPGSGNQAHAKGDVRKKGELRAEAKFTRSKQYILKLADLEKIRAECAHGEAAAFQIDFLNQQTNRVEDSWVVVTYDDWKELRNASRIDR